MTTNLAAIAGLDSASQARVVLYSSGQLIHAPLNGVQLQITDPNLDTLSSGTTTLGTTGLAVLGAETKAAALAALGMPYIVTPEEYGAVGDGDGAGGGTDDATALQDMLDNANGRVIWMDGSKIYKCLSALQMPSNTTIMFNGSTIDYTGLTATNDDFTSNMKLCLYAKGTGRGTSSALTANASEGDFTVTVSNGAAFSAGAWVQMTAEDAYTYDGSTSVKKGEIIQILSVSGNNVTFRTPLLDDYTTANTATLHNISFAENIHLDRPSIIGTGIENDRCEGLRLLWVKGFSIKNVNIEAVDMRALHIANTINGDIDEGYIDGVRYTGTGLLFYAVTFNNCAQNITVRGIKGQEVRHLYVNSSSTGDYGQPYYITVSDCHAWNMMSGGAFASFAYEHHGFGRFITIADCTANGCYSGLNVEGSDIKVSNCTFRNCRQHGIMISDGRDIRNVALLGNRVSFQTDEVTTARAALAIHPSGNANADITNLVVDGLEVDGWVDPVNGVCYGVRVWPFQTAKTVVLRNITLHSDVASGNTDYGFYIEQPGIIVENPVTHNYNRAFRVVTGADDVTIVSPIVSNDAAGTAPAFQIGADDCVVRNPTFRTTYRAFVIDASANNTIVTHKVSKNVSLADSDSGTGTVITDGSVT